MSDFDEIESQPDQLFQFNGVGYFQGQWHWDPDFEVQGWWLTVVNNFDGSGIIRAVLNRPEGLSKIDIPFNQDGLFCALYNSVPSMDRIMRGGERHDTDQDDLKTFSEMQNVIRIAYYMVSDNTEISPRRNRSIPTYTFNSSGGIHVPTDITVVDIGTSAGKAVTEVEAAGIVKPAHWHVDTNGKILWLYGHDSHSENILEAPYDETPVTDEELVELNKNKINEADFVFSLSKENSEALDEGRLSYEEIRAMGIKEVHEARARLSSSIVSD